MTVTKTNVTISLTQPNDISLDCQVFRLPFGWHGDIMAPDHPKMIFGVHWDRMHESKVSLDGFRIRKPRCSYPGLEQSILIATILKISKLQDYLVLAVVVRELSKHQSASCLIVAFVIARFVSLSCFSSAKNSACSSGKRIVEAPECLLLDCCVCYC